MAITQVTGTRLHGTVVLAVPPHLFPLPHESAKLGPALGPEPFSSIPSITGAQLE